MDSTSDDGLDLSRFIRKNREYYEAIGEFADFWSGTMSRGPEKKVGIKVLRGGSKNRPGPINTLTNAPPFQNLRTHGVIWRRLQHPNVATFYGLAFNCGIMPALILDYYPKGNIMEFLKREIITIDHKLRLIKEISLGIEYLHEHNPPVIHGDIRGSNIFIDDNGRPVLADYGLTFVIESVDFTSAKAAGNCRWTAPEIMDPPIDDDSIDSSSFITFASDVFAFAMTVIEIITEKPPYASKKNDGAVILAIINGQRPDIPPEIPESLSNLLKRCWKKDPAERPSAQEIRESLDIYENITIQPPLSWIRRYLYYLWPF